MTDLPDTRSEAFATYMNQAREAADDPVKYAEFILRDEQNQRVSMHSLHIAMHAHIEFCEAHHLKALIEVPWGTGKTTNALSYITRKIGKDLNLRGKIICGIEDDSEKRLVGCANILQSRLYRSVFPAVKRVSTKKRELGRKWTGGEIYIDRPASMSLEPTLEARAVLGEGTGTRADFILFDDVVTLKNAILEPGNRKKVIEVVEDVWMQRLDPQHGFALWLCTPWHDADCSNYYLTKAKRGQGDFCALLIAVTKDCRNMQVEIHNAPSSYERETGIRDGMILPPWMHKFPPAFLLKELAKNERSFSRGRWLKPYTSKDLLFPSFGNCWKSFNIGSVVGKNWPRIFGVDLAGKKRKGNVIFVGALSPTKKRIPLEVRIGQWSSSEWTRNMTELYRKHDPRIIVIENNALQEMVIGMVEDNPEKYPWWDLIDHFTTGKQKADPEYGLPGMEIEFSNGAWEISNELISTRNGEDLIEHDPACDCGNCRWKAETATYTRESAEAADSVMAMWFFDHGCRVLTGYGLEQGEDQAPEPYIDLLAR